MLGVQLQIFILTLSTREQSSNLTLRGKRLVLQYTNGSPCGPTEKKRAIIDGDHNPSTDGEVTRRKSALISFHCEKDPVITQTPPTFVGTDPDECAYFFEIRSVHACGGSEPTKQGVGPGAVFTIIGVIAILVYFLGGVFYQRNVAHARGWRQLPNYSMWAGIGSFIKVSGQSCFNRPKHMLFPRVTSVRDGLLPTREASSRTRSKSRSSRAAYRTSFPP